MSEDLHIKVVSPRLSSVDFEERATTLNDLDDSLPKGRGRCFDIGIWGGCGVSCAAFVDGECKEPQEISREDIIEEYGLEEAEEIMSLYRCFEDAPK